jgi:hypothetical protein
LAEDRVGDGSMSSVDDDAQEGRRSGDERQ